MENEIETHLQCIFLNIKVDVGWSLLLLLLF